MAMCILALAIIAYIHLFINTAPTDSVVLQRGVLFKNESCNQSPREIYTDSDFSLCLSSSGT